MYFIGSRVHIVMQARILNAFQWYLWVMKVNIFLNRTMAGWFKSTYFHFTKWWCKSTYLGNLTIWQWLGDSNQHTFILSMGDSSQHNCKIRQQDNGWVTQVNILSFYQVVMQVNILGKLNDMTMVGWFKSTYFHFINWWFKSTYFQLTQQTKDNHCNSTQTHNQWRE